MLWVPEDSIEAESRESVDDGTLSEASNEAEVDTIIGRIYNYDYAVKLLTLSKWILASCWLCFRNCYKPEYTGRTIYRHCSRKFPKYQGRAALPGKLDMWIQAKNGRRIALPRVRYRRSESCLDDQNRVSNVVKNDGSVERTQRKEETVELVTVIEFEIQPI